MFQSPVILHTRITRNYDNGSGDADVGDRNMLMQAVVVMVTDEQRIKEIGK